MPSSVPQGRVLPRSFYARSAPEVARDLIGTVLVHGSTSGRIVETEAYIARDEQGRIDFAAHASRGRTLTTDVIFGPPGHAYVYLIYGMYECLNIVAEPDGSPGCVLIRALEPVSGIARMRLRRGGEDVHKLANGPGKLTLAMGISRRHNRQDMTEGPLVVRGGGEWSGEIGVSPRVGIRKSVDLPLRFYAKNNRFVSKGS